MLAEVSCDRLLMNGKAAHKFVHGYQYSSPRPKPEPQQQLKQQEQEVHVVSMTTDESLDVSQLHALIGRHVGAVAGAAKLEGMAQRDIDAYAIHLGQALNDIWNAWRMTRAT